MILNFLNKKNNIENPPWHYDFLLNLDEKEYPRYLAKLFKLNTGENLPLKYDFKNQAWVIDKNKCKTFNQKIQWLKLYGVTDLMRMCTDKVAVRDYVKEKIGEEYLKPVLQIIPDIKSSPLPDPPPTGEGAVVGAGTSLTNAGEGIALAENDVTTYFDQIDFDKLPNSFVIKCNHGSKWQYIIKDKEQFLNTPKLVEIVKRQMTGWLEQEFFPWNGFEMQYATSRRVVSHNSNSGVRTRLSEGKVNDRTESEVNYLPERKGCQEKGIEPKLLIEPFFQNKDNTPLREIEVYCFNGKPKIFVNVRYGNQREISYYDKNFNQIDLILHPDGQNMIINEKADDYINQTFDISIRLSKDFNFVRIDYFVFNNKLYFNEITFTPYSGIMKFDKKWNKKLGSWIEL